LLKRAETLGIDFGDDSYFGEYIFKVLGFNEIVYQFKVDRKYDFTMICLVDC
jgi:hypothetical protein